MVCRDTTLNQFRSQIQCAKRRGEPDLVKFLKKQRDQFKQTKTNNKRLIRNMQARQPVSKRVGNQRKKINNRKKTLDVEGAHIEPRISASNTLESDKPKREGIELHDDIRESECESTSHNCQSPSDYQSHVFDICVPEGVTYRRKTAARL